MTTKDLIKPNPRINKELAYIKRLIEQIVEECPVRRPTSEDEHRAQMIAKEEFEKLGLATHEEHFYFNDSLYANMALHFGLGSLGTMVSGLAPLLGFVLHTTAGFSYLADSTRRAYFLRRLFPFKPSQNLVAAIPAQKIPDLRLVFLAHADAAFTGLLFNPKIVERFSRQLPRPLRFLKRSLAISTRSQFILAGFDLLRMCFGPLTWPLRPIEYLISIPGFIAFVLNMEVVIRNEIVPGANDNLSAVAALLILAQRLMPKVPDNVELVFVVTGCEEASLGGGDALARAKEGIWDKDKTVIIGMDGLSNGELKFAEIEGEVVRTPIPRWLKGVVEQTAASNRKFAEVTGFEIPVGGTDVAAFLAHGYEGMSLVCVDPKVGSPLHYHTSNDTPQNLDWNKILFSIDFAEKLAHSIVEFKLGR